MRRLVPRMISALLATLFLANSSFAAAPITNGLVLSVEADPSKISGTTWSPSDGTSYSATLQNSAMYVVSETSVAFGDSTNQYANFGNILSTPNSITGEAWVRIDTMHTTGWNIIATKWFNGSPEDWHFAFKLKKISLYFYNNNFIEEDTAREAGWYHAAFTVTQPSEGTCPGTTTSGTVKLFINGVEVKSVTSINSCHRTSSSALFLLGDSRGQGLLGLDGRLAKFRFYTRALTPSEIAFNYRAEAATYLLEAAPFSTSSPTISGSARVGSQQTGGVGLWNNTPTSYSYRWYRSLTSGGTYSPISGATVSTYTATSDDLNQYLKLQVTASNSSGDTTETSTATQILAGSLNLNLSIATTNAAYRTSRNITLDAGVSGKATFFVNGKRIAGCIGKSANSANLYIISCNWKPSKVGPNQVTANFTPTDIGITPAITSPKFIFVERRTTTRG